jgi:HNH endonuclease
MDEIAKNLIEIQDYLVPKLDTYEQAIYHYILRHTYLIGQDSTLFSTRSAEIGLGSGVDGNTPSGNQKSKKLRSLELKGAVKILERSHKGILVQIVLPKDIDGLIYASTQPELEIESLDFYKDKRLLVSILEREGYKCFYTGKKIKEETCYLDHVVAQSSGGNNSYKNIVASCYDANSLKNNKPVDEFLRALYKNEILSLNEFEEMKLKLKKLQNGELVPSLISIKSAISV